MICIAVPRALWLHIYDRSSGALALHVLVSSLPMIYIDMPRARALSHDFTLETHSEHVHALYHKMAYQTRPIVNALYTPTIT